MRKQSNKKEFKEGAASIYIVVIASLIFGIISVAFLRLIVKESIMTTNDEMSQTAYDSALAGVEDAKIALKKYYSGEIDASNLFSPPNEDNCDLVSGALERARDAGSGVIIQETLTGDSSIAQSYTCVVMRNILPDYRTTLSIGDNIRVIPLKTGTPNEVKRVRIAWHSRSNGADYNYNYYSTNFFPNANNASVPPVLSAQFFQTSAKYKITDFNTAEGDKTDRGTVMLVPTSNHYTANATAKGTEISAGTLAASNDHVTKNNPQLVFCRSSGIAYYDPSDEYACVAIIDLPEPIGGNRSEETFFLVLSMPYNNTQTDVSIELYGANNKALKFKDVQIVVDSTGRTNDMYSRVEARIEINAEFPYPEYALQITGADSDSIRKDFYIAPDCWEIDNSKEQWTVKKCKEIGS